VICNNRGYGAIRGGRLNEQMKNYHAEQFIAEAAVDFQPDYAMIAQGAGAFGRTVTKPEEVKPALREALDAVRSGKPAVLDVHLLREV
jgi:acetolactate synthase-1/2/3 large subunit